MLKIHYYEWIERTECSIEDSNKATRLTRGYEMQLEECTTCQITDGRSLFSEECLDED
jgi:hypothetical protein